MRARINPRYIRAAPALHRLRACIALANETLRACNGSSSSSLGSLAALAHHRRGGIYIYIYICIPRVYPCRASSEARRALSAIPTALSFSLLHLRAPCNTLSLQQRLPRGIEPGDYPLRVEFITAKSFGGRREARKKETEEREEKRKGREGEERERDVE